MRNAIIGITVDTASGHTAEQWLYESPSAYSRSVARAGGVPILLPYVLERIPEYLDLCDGFLLSGGDDPDLTGGARPPHPQTKLMHRGRQDFDSALIAALDGTSQPVLGICLGMQMMALNAGGQLHEHLADAPGFDPERAGQHRQHDHVIKLRNFSQPYLSREGVVHSRHHQAVADPGTLRTLAEFDGVIEAIDQPGRYYIGVQWHPEITQDAELGFGLIQRFVQACSKP